MSTLSVQAYSVDDGNLLPRFVRELDAAAKAEDLTGERGDVRLPLVILECAERVGAWAIERDDGWALVERSTWSTIQSAERMLAGVCKADRSAAL